MKCAHQKSRLSPCSVEENASFESSYSNKQWNAIFSLKPCLDVAGRIWWPEGTTPLGDEEEDRQVNMR
jgi:hypothetical protein